MVIAGGMQTYMTIVFMLLVFKAGTMVLEVNGIRIDIADLSFIIMCPLPVLYIIAGRIGVRASTEPDKARICIRLGTTILIIHAAIIALMSIEEDGVSIPVIMLLLGLPFILPYLSAAFSLKAMTATEGNAMSDEKT